MKKGLRTRDTLDWLAVVADVAAILGLLAAGLGLLYWYASKKPPVVIVAVAAVVILLVARVEWISVKLSHRK
jgi:membrane protein YdbS with pleckstrin-like domain